MTQTVLLMLIKRKEEQIILLDALYCDYDPTSRSAILDLFTVRRDELVAEYKSLYESPSNSQRV